MKMKALIDKIGATIKKQTPSVKKSQKYSLKWFASVPDSVLHAERESIRKQYCLSGKDKSKGIRLQNLLRLFDNEMSKRSWGNEIPHGPGYHREHGFNLYKKD